MAKYALLTGLVLSAFAVSAAPSFAGEKGEKTEEQKKKYIEKYDKDGDGVLNDEEKAAAKADKEKRKAEKEAEKAE
ncbi:MAG TPA: hypothetical protein VGN72_11970 [Tepidisphaeraceae bacterium]|jgi:hypothetical protein|nr:hypothetical protein [Tepidisphaeraceae bacterium]